MSVSPHLHLLAFIHQACTLMILFSSSFSSLSFPLFFGSSFLSSFHITFFFILYSYIVWSQFFSCFSNNFPSCIIFLLTPILFFLLSIYSFFFLYSLSRSFPFPFYFLVSFYNSLFSSRSPFPSSHTRFLSFLLLSFLLFVLSVLILLLLLLLLFIFFPSSSPFLLICFL